MRLLIVEDEMKLQHELIALFERAGYQVDAVSRAFDGIEQGMSLAYDCIILDYMLPDSTGIEVVKALRDDGCSTPVLMLTVKNETQDRVVGLNAGADDYLGKPFAPEELLARVSALVRRVPTIADNDMVTRGEVTLHMRSRSLELHGKVLELTSKEFALMETLFRHEGQVLTRNQLISRVWGPDAEVADSALDTYIYFLRKKCADIGWKRAIKTIRGQGYILHTEGA